MDRPSPWALGQALDTSRAGRRALAVGVAGLLLGLLLVLVSLTGPGLPLIVLGGMLILAGVCVWLIRRNGRPGR